MGRYGFRLRIKPGTEEEYKKRHQAVYSELLQAFKDYGIQTYSIFMDGTTLFAYMETEDINSVMKALEENEANKKWQTHMSDMLIPDDDGVTMVPIDEVFYFHS